MYGIGFLDDIHNYFPALLYDTESFLTAQDVLRYVQNRTVQRFNVYDNARAEYRTNRLNAAIQASALRRFNSPQDIIRAYTNPPNIISGQASASAPLAAAPLAAAPVTTGLLQRQGQGHTHIHILRSSQPIIQGSDFSALFPLLRSLEMLTSTYENDPPELPILPSRLYEDVVVHATQEVIDQASRVSIISTDLENNCSICQDRLMENDIMRTLIGCGHEFHKQCIDPWLLTRSTICPTCRYDIRETDILIPAAPAINIRQPVVEADEFINLLFGRTF